MIGNNKKENMEITTDTHGIYMRDYNTTLCTRYIQNFYGYYNDRGEYVENGTHEVTTYRYAHDPMELYELNQNQPAVRLEDYEAPYFEQACYKGIPMRYRFNPTIRNLMKTKRFRIKYRGGSKPQYNYKRLPNHTLAEYADTFAIYPK